MHPDDEDSLDEYLRYAATSRGVPEEFENWAIDHNLKLPKKKKPKDSEYGDDITD
jgi:hypothetical protein